MKKSSMKKILAFASLIVIATSFCFAKKIEAETVVVNSDWKDKALGEVENPAWVMQLIRGGDSVFRREWGVKSDRVIRTGRGSGFTQNSAKTKSQLSVASAIANELKMNIIANLDQNESVSKGDIRVVNEIATSTKVQITNLREETDFWWKTLERDPKTKKVITRYAYITVYSMPKDVWDKTVETYMLSVMRQIENKDLQRAIGAQASTLKALSDKDNDSVTLSNQYKNIIDSTSTEKTDEQKDLDDADDLLRSMLM